MQYYLKARFHFNKDQFADLMVISGVAGTISQVLRWFGRLYDFLCILPSFIVSVSFSIVLKTELHAAASHALAGSCFRRGEATFDRTLF